MRGDFIKPNVLCVGFAKCGTTTLYDILIQHPDIYLSGIKEPLFYGNKKLEKNGFDWYIKRYYPKYIKEKIIMEINPVIGKYVSAEQIKQDYGKNTKIIFIIRNPIKRLYSNFKMNLIKGDCFDNKKDNIGNSMLLFDRWIVSNFLNNDLEVISNDVIPKFCKSGDYYNKVKNYYNVFGKKQVKVIVFEDFVKNPKKICEEIYDFIGIKSYSNINYNLHSNNGNRVVRNIFALSLNRNFINKVWPNFFIKYFKYVSFKFSSSLNKIVWGFPLLFTKENFNEDGVSKISENILEIYYKDMIGNLSDLLNIDFYKKWNIKKKSILLKEDIIVNILKAKYNQNIVDIKKQYYYLSKKMNSDKLIENMINNRLLILNLINDILHYYKEFNLCDCIFLIGSFSRMTCTYSSDVDINIIYSDKYKNIVFPLELKTNYIISSVLNFKGCDRVHTMMVYTKKINDDVVDLIDEKYVVYKKNKIRYFCRNNYNSLLSDTFNTSRNYQILIDYLDNNINNDNIFKEWLYNFEVIMQKNSLFNEQININFKKVKNYKNISKKIIIEIDNLINVIDNRSSNSIYIDNKISISKMKSRYKSDIVNKINETLLILNYIHCDTYMNFYSLIKNKIITEKFKNDILYFLNMITKIQIVLDKLGYDLSSHSTLNIEKNIFQNKYYEIYKRDYEKELHEHENLIYSGIIEVLKNEKIKLEV